ncbi:MAG: hypothetical protein N3F05_04815 [Candidatus Diapherotrites archaeon]|nr:hypothetical protein [Candidatus Diapherotrites archaeon]
MIKKFAFRGHEKKLIVVLFASMAVIFLFLFLVPDKKMTANVIVSNQVERANDKTSAEQTVDKVTPDTDLTSQNPIWQMRLNYGIPLSVFENLPQVPHDFNAIVSLMHRNAYTNYDFFSERYFLQPEFYPSFTDTGLIYWQNPDPKHYAVAGIGFFPGTQQIKVKKGNYSKTKIFLHAGFGVRTYQGIKISAFFVDDCNGISFELPKKDFLIGPSYPKFDSQWALDIPIKIKASENTVKSNCELKFRIEKPSEDNSIKWRTAYGKKYFETAEAGAINSTSITIKIE